MKRLVVTLCAALAIMLVGCGPSAEEKMKAEQDRLFEMPISKSGNDSLLQLHYSVSADFETNNSLSTTLKIEQLCRKAKGYIENSALKKNTISSTTIAISADSSEIIKQFNFETNLVVQVPTENASAFVDSLSFFATTLNARQLQTENLSSNLSQAKATAAAYAASYSKFQEDYPATKAGKFTPQQQLETKQNYVFEKTSANIALQNLQFKTAFTTIELSFYDLPRIQKTKIQNLILPSAYGTDFLSEVATSLLTGLTTLKKFTLTLLRIWPLLLVIATGIWLFKVKKWTPDFIKNNAQNSDHK